MNQQHSKSISHPTQVWIFALALAIGIMLTMTPVFGATEANEPTMSSTFPKPTAVTNESEWKPHAGLIAGVASPEGNYDSSMDYGLDIGFQPMIPFGLGLELSHSTNNNNDSLTGADLSRTKLLARGTYNFGGTIPVIKSSYVGLAAGPLFESEAGRDRIYLGVAPMLGFDIPLKQASHDFLSLGLNAKYLYSSGGGPDALTVAGMVKYWF